MSITRSKQRIKQTGEVFTPGSLVREMLLQIPDDVWADPTKTFLEPAAGDGNFVAQIIRRKIKFGSTPVQALSTTFAVEMMPDNHKAMQERILKIVGATPEHRRIVEKNIVCANALEYDFSFGEPQEEPEEVTTEDEFFVY